MTTSPQDDLILGSFVTSTSQKPQLAIDLARVSEAAGLDIVTFQDHPYQPSMLDGWTLLSYVAARTERIHVSGNVLNLPLRPPTVLARAAASLDLLTCGRFELGIGAGGIWPQIEKMGVRRLTPSQAADALSEAIDIIRAMWEVRGGDALWVDGAYYQVKGVARGPSPAQVLNIPGQFGAANGELLSGPPEHWVEELLTLTRTHRFTGYLLWSDDPTTIARFGNEVAPALREALAASTS